MSTRSSFAPILGVCLFALACSPTKPSSDTPVESTTQAVDPSDTSADETTTKAERGTVELSPLHLERTVELGTTLRYSYESWASVGRGADFSITDPTVIGHVETDQDYAQPEADRPPGGDLATGTFVFEALAVGTTTIHVANMFRGTAEAEYDFVITVVAP